MRQVIPLGILQELIRTIEEQRLIPRESSLLLSLSGGTDSTAMAHLISTIREEWKLQLMAVHINHKLRAEESETDRQFVESMCESLSIPLVVRTGRIDSSRERGNSLQSEARRIRYALLEEERKTTGIDLIATAHQRDDRVETLLLNLFRGSGLRGLGGMPYRRDRIVRPLLDIPRNSIEEYLRENGISSSLDRTNLETNYDRNKVRLQIVPFVEKTLGRSVTAPLARAAEVAAELDRFAGSLAREWVESTGEKGEAPFRKGIAARELSELPKALGREVVRLGIESVCGSPLRISHLMVERVLDLSHGNAGKEIELLGGFLARREGDVIIFGERPPEAPPFECPLDIPGSVELPDGTVVRTVVRAERGGPCGESPQRGGDRITLDAERISSPLLVRRRRPGDRFQPLGAPGSKKVHDLMVDRKVPRQRRDSIPIVADCEGIIWVAGVEIAERVKVTANTTKLLEVAIKWAD